MSDMTFAVTGSSWLGKTTETSSSELQLPFGSRKSEMFQIDSGSSTGLGGLDSAGLGSGMRSTPRYFYENRYQHE